MLRIRAFTKGGVCRLSRRNDGIEFERNEITPVVCPGLQQVRVLALDHLKTPIEGRLDSTINVNQSLRHQATLVAEALVNGLGIAVPKMLDHHIMHRS